MIAELRPEESRKLLSEQSLARLGCVLPGGEPYVVPVNYLFSDEFIFIHSLPGLKVEALRRNPKACVQVDSIRNFFNWRSVIVFGEFEEILDPEERAEFLRRLAAHFQKLTPVEAVTSGGGGRGDAAAEMVLFRLRIKHISGLCES